MEDVEIHLIPRSDNPAHDTIVGIADDQLVINEQIIDAVSQDKRLFSHVVFKLAGNLAVHKNLDIEDVATQIPLLRSIRDELITAMAANSVDQNPHKSRSTV